MCFGVKEYNSLDLELGYTTSMKSYLGFPLPSKRVGGYGY